MRILTVYYSLEGNCRALADVIQEAVGGDVEGLRPEKEIPRKGFRRLLIGGWMTWLGQSCPNPPLTKNIADYDLIFVGTPVWAWRMSPPIRRFLTETDFTGQYVALYAMHARRSGWTLRAMQKQVEARGGRVVSAADFRDLRRGDPYPIRKRAAVWAREVVDSMDKI